MEVKGSDTEKKPSQLRKKVQRLKKCSILLVPMAIGLGILAVQFFRMETRAGKIVALIILIIGVPFLLYLMSRAYRDLCIIEKLM